MENNALELKSLDTVIYAEELIVMSDEQYVSAIEFCKGLKNLEVEIDSAYDEAIASAFKTHRTLVATKKKYIEPVEKARKLINVKCLEYKKRRDDEQRERDRLIQEAAAQRAKELYSNQGDGEECLATDSEGQSISGVLVSPTNIGSNVGGLPDVAGFSVRKDWDFVIEDPSLVPAEYKIIDEKKIRAVAKALKDQCRIPGVRVFEKEIAVNRA